MCIITSYTCELSLYPLTLLLSHWSANISIWKSLGILKLVLDAVAHLGWISGLEAMSPDIAWDLKKSWPASWVKGVWEKLHPL